MSSAERLIWLAGFYSNLRWHWQAIAPAGGGGRARVCQCRVNHKHAPLIFPSAESMAAKPESSSSSRARVFLDIEIGDRAAFDAQTREYHACLALLRRSAAAYGFPPSFADMTDDERATFEEFAANAPNALAAVRTRPPPPLAAGRIELELFDDDAPRACENFRALVRFARLDSGRELGWFEFCENAIFNATTCGVCVLSAP
jgi:hypothetical protein